MPGDEDAQCVEHWRARERVRRPGVGLDGDHMNLARVGGVDDKPLEGRDGHVRVLRLASVVKDRPVVRVRDLPLPGRLTFLRSRKRLCHSTRVSER